MKTFAQPVVHPIDFRWTDFLEELPQSFTRVQSEWLNDAGSLTKKFQQRFDTDIRFFVSFANWSHATQEECQLLSLAPDATIWQRDITWSYHQKPWVHGRCIIPKTTLDDTLKTLGQRSIGNILFREQPCSRSPFTFSLLNDQKIARRSIFQYDQGPLLLTEFFTTDFLNEIA